jgi:hypothetical protein
MVSYRSGDLVGAREIVGRYLAGARSYELVLIAAWLTGRCARGGRSKPIPNHTRRVVALVVG